MEALEAIFTRRSTRSFRPDPVEQEKLDLILTAGRQAPSGGNNQTNHFLVIRNREVLNALIRMTETAFSLMEADENTYASLRHSIAASKKGGYVFCYDAPVLIVVANRRDYGNNMSDCACAIENMMVAAQRARPGQLLDQSTEVAQRGTGHRPIPDRARHERR